MSEQEIVSRTDELTDTVQILAESFANLRADHRPEGSDWFRWRIFDDSASKVIGTIGLDQPEDRALSLPDIKVLLRTRALNLLMQAA
jgi:hypothetical protein